jgi:hypothetical protein
MHKVRQFVAILVQMLLYLSGLCDRAINSIDSALNRNPVDFSGIADREARDHLLWNLTVVLLLRLLELGCFRCQTFGTKFRLGGFKKFGVFLGDLFCEGSRGLTNDDDGRAVDE